MGKDEIEQRVINAIADGSFVSFCGIKVEHVACGELVLSMLIDDHIINVYGIAHGGALATLIDTCMGAGCFTVGKQVVTIDMHVTYVKAVQHYDTATATLHLIHNGKSTVSTEVVVTNGAGELCAKGSGNFFVIKKDTYIPEKW